MTDLYIDNDTNDIYDKLSKASNVIISPQFTKMDKHIYNELTYRQSYNTQLNYKLISEENKYLELLKNISNFGIDSKDRTNTGTKSLFGCHLEFSLMNNTMPLLTTKKVYWKGVVEELLWFIKGSTNSKLLHTKNVKIWD